jgi:hypothetical protein
MNLKHYSCHIIWIFPHKQLCDQLDKMDNKQRDEWIDKYWNTLRNHNINNSLSMTHGLDLLYSIFAIVYANSSNNRVHCFLLDTLITLHYYWISDWKHVPSWLYVALWQRYVGGIHFMRHNPVESSSLIVLWLERFRFNAKRYHRLNLIYK